MYESYKSFSLEDKQWNQSFYDATKNKMNYNDFNQKYIFSSEPLN